MRGQADQLPNLIDLDSSFVHVQGSGTSCTSSCEPALGDARLQGSRAAASLLEPDNNSSLTTVKTVEEATGLPAEQTFVNIGGTVDEAQGLPASPQTPIFKLHEPKIQNVFSFQPAPTPPALAQQEMAPPQPVNTLLTDAFAGPPHVTSFTLDSALPVQLEPLRP